MCSKWWWEVFPLCRVVAISGYIPLLSTLGNNFLFEIFKILLQHFSSSNVPCSKKSQAAGMTVNTFQCVLTLVGAGLLQSEFKSVVQEHEEFSLSRKMPSNTTLHDCWPICRIVYGKCFYLLASATCLWILKCVGFGGVSPHTSGLAVGIPVQREPGFRIIH